MPERYETARMWDRVSDILMWIGLGLFVLCGIVTEFVDAFAVAVTTGMALGVLSVVLIFASIVASIEAVLSMIDDMEYESEGGDAECPWSP